MTQCGICVKSKWLLGRRLDVLPEPRDLARIEHEIEHNWHRAKWREFHEWYKKTYAMLGIGEEYDDAQAIDAMRKLIPESAKGGTITVSNLETEPP